MKSPLSSLGLVIFFAAMGFATNRDIPACAADPPGIEKKWQPDDSGYQKTINPFLKNYCASCHTGTKAKGTFRSDTGAVNNFVDPSARETWSDIVNVLNGNEMPPKKARQPAPAEVAAVVDWITAQSVRAEMIPKRPGCCPSADEP